MRMPYGYSQLKKISSNLKLQNQKKEMLEKMNQDLADLIPDKKKAADN